MSDKTPFIRAIEECENFIDVEATLRAEVARLTAELADANFARSTMMGGCDSLANQLVVAKAEVARLEKELDTERAWHRSTKMSLSDEHASRQYWEREANTDHRGEAQEAKRNEAHARDMERRVTEALKQVESENTRLTAEVERLEGREREMESMAVAALGRDYCFVCEADTRSKRAPHGHFDDCELATWLAGCKP